MHHAIQSYTLITFVVVGLSHLLRPRDWADTYARLHRLGPTGAFINGGLSLLPGAALVAAHPVYAGPAIIVTLLGWALVLKGSVCLVAPSVALRGMAAAADTAAAGRRFIAAGILALAIAAGAAYALWKT